MSLEIIPPPVVGQFLPPVRDGIIPEQQLTEPEKKIDPNQLHHLGNLANSTLLPKIESNGVAEAHRNTISTLLTMQILTDNGEFIKASNGENYAHPFGRDTEHVINFGLSSLRAITAANDGKNHGTSRLRPIIEQGIVSLVAHIGTKDELLDGKWRPSGQAPGKMFHEAGEIADSPLVKLVEDWQDPDERDSDYLTYYGSIDSTPLFVCIVSDYDQCIREPKSPEAADSFLNKLIPHHNGKDKLTIGEAVIMSTNWIINELEKSDLGFVEYQRHPGQEKGIRNQVMKDSLTSYVHKNGELANTNAPIASIEVQAMAYDALLDAADMFERAPEVAEKQQVSTAAITKMRQAASGLLERILDDHDGFWIADEKRFAQAKDRDPITAKPRNVDTPSSNELELLDSRLLHDIKDKTKQMQYVSSLVRQAMSDEFLTEAGIRSRGKSQWQLVDFNDYHGSGTSWPVISHKVANGLLGWGMNDLAKQLDTRVLNAINIGDNRNELFLVDPVTDEVFYRYMTKQQADEQGVKNGKLIVGTNIPEVGQAWSEEAALDIKTKNEVGTYKMVDPNCPEWIIELEREIMASIKQESVIKYFEEIKNRREQSQLAIIDLVAGSLADRRYYERADATLHTAKAA